MAGLGDTSLVLFVHNEVFGTGIEAVAVGHEEEPIQTGEAGLAIAAGLAVLEALETVRRLKVKVLSCVARLRALAVDGRGVVQGTGGTHVVASAGLAVGGARLAGEGVCISMETLGTLSDTGCDLHLALSDPFHAKEVARVT